MMKRTLITMIACSLMTVATAQTPNPEVKRSLEQLSDMGFITEYFAFPNGQEYQVNIAKNQQEFIDNLVKSQISNASNPSELKGIQKQIDYYKKSQEIANKYGEKARKAIRSLFETLAPQSKKCYRYETHEGKKDTVLYVLAMGDVNNKVFNTYKQGGYNASDKFEILDYSENENGYSLKYRFAPLKKSEEGKEYPITTLEKDFKALVAPYHGKEYKVNYQYDSNKDMDELYIIYNFKADNKTTISNAKGIHYFFPVEKEKQNEILEKVRNLTINYLNTKANTTDYYFYDEVAKKTEGDFGGGNLMLTDRGYDGNSFINICAKNTPEGLHLIEYITVGNGYNAPYHWWEIKSIKNNKPVYEKDFYNK